MRLQAYREPAALRRHAQHDLSVRSPGTRPAGTGPLYRRRSPARAAGALLVGAMLVGLSGCNPFADPPPCPKVSILKQTRHLTLYGEGPARDDANVAFALELRDLAGQCDHDVDDEEGGGVEVTFDLPIYATRGPAAETDRLSVPFFVAIAGPSRQIVAKEIFTAQLIFETGSTSTQTVEEIEQWIPLGPGEIGVGYETLIGFQLTAAQLKELRRPKEE